MAAGLTVIGLDALTLDVVEPLAAAGELPNLSRVLAGAYGPLRSTTHPLTPHAWVTMSTGVNAGRHGIWDFLERDAEGYGFSPVNGSHRRAPAVWDYLTSSERRVGLVSVPFTWPAPEVNGFAVSGFDAPVAGGGHVHPSSLQEEVDRRFGDYRLDDVSPVDDRGEFNLDQVKRAVEAKAKLTLWLADRFDPEFLFVVFMAADYVHHHSWPDWEARGSQSRVADVYRTLDAAVGELRRTGRDVMIVSDHGAGSLKGVISLNGWLAQEGYLAYRAEPGRLGQALRRRVVGGNQPPTSVLDWSRTRVFAYGMFGNLVINLRGREQHGIVAEHEYEPLRAELAQRLLGLRADNGEQVVAAVHRREDLFSGPELNKVPDLIVEFNEYAWLGTGSPQTRSNEFWDTTAMRIGASGGWAGSHRPDGIIALSGPSVHSGTRLTAGIKDVAPTALFMLGEGIPQALEGRVLTEALSNPHPAPLASDSEPAQLSPPREYEDDEAKAVEDRLRSLGYLE